MTNPTLEAKISDIHSWWEVPCIAHFCSLFRASFNLIDFDIEDLEEALLTDDASDSGNTLIQELIVRLLRGYYANNSISTFNYQMFLRRLFRQKCREFKCYNPFDNDIDFQFLPMRTKVEILHMLCDFRLDADDVLDILKDLDSDSLRVHPLGFDANKSAYWYFYGTRLYREDYPNKKKEKEKKRGRKHKRGRNKEEDSEHEEVVELGSGVWQVVCFTESDWERLAVNTEDAIHKNEQVLHQIIEEDFLPEIPKLFQEKERLQRKRFLELHPRKSSRIESLNRRKQEEKHCVDRYQRVLSIDSSDSEADSKISFTKEKTSRYERWKNRNSQKEHIYYSDYDNTDCESLQGSVHSFRTNSRSFICGRGRQTNNSLSSATTDMLLQTLEKSRSPDWFDTKLEDLHNGLYKVLNKLKEHEDAWPFLEPVDEEVAPNYYKIVKEPMSLQRMEDKLDNGKYKTFSEFKKDFQLILSNCKQYNGSRNEYTIRGENLKKVFNISVNRFIPPGYSSADEKVTENCDFSDVISAHKKRKKKRKRHTSSKSIEDADKENEQKLSDLTYSMNSLETETRRADAILSLESKIGERKRGKGRPPKNASALYALDIVTEQTLRDVIKMLDDTPKFNEFCPTNTLHPSIAPPPTPPALPLSLTSPEPVVDIPFTVNNETGIPPKLVPRPHKPKDPNKKRSIKENHHKHLQQIKHQRRRDIQRTIDRLQPGKSKGNLISTINKTLSNRPSSTEEPSGSKESTTKTENGPPRPKPMLSLGSVLSTDIINLDMNTKKHMFSDNDSLPSENDDLFSDNDALGEQNEMQAENLAIDKTLHCEQIDTDEKKVEESPEKYIIPKQEHGSIALSETVKSVPTNVEKSTDKPKPNLGAWFKAFGAPKTQSGAKKKADLTNLNESPATPLLNEVVKDDDSTTVARQLTRTLLDDDKYDLNEPPPPTPGRYFLYDDEKEQRSVHLPYQSPSETTPGKRQRRQSTGSSMSERSSFSQDPNDHMNSPHPSLDESVYQSPQPYQHSISNTAALKVGFYQDAFSKCGSDKSNSCSPRDPVNSPMLSPRDLLNSVSPQHPMFSPRDSVASTRDSCSPRGPVCSPRGEPMACCPREHNAMNISSPRSTVTSPRYTAVSPRDTYAESMKGNFMKSPVYTPAAPVDIDPKSFKNSQVEKHLYPMKKRISAELEQSNRMQQNENEEKEQQQQQQQQQSQMFAKAERHYNSVPVAPPFTQHILPPTAYTNEASTISMTLAHSQPLTYMESYPPPPSDSMLMNHYFCKELYGVTTPQGITPPVSSQSSLLMPQETLTQSHLHYSVTSRQPTAYDRVNVPIDFTASASSAPLSLTNKSNDSYSLPYHPKYEDALNYSNKNPQHPYYSMEADGKLNLDYQSNKLEPSTHHYDSRTASSIYHAAGHVAHSYHTSAYPYPNIPAHVDYYNDEKSPDYQMADLRYSNYGRSNAAARSEEKQYYQGTQIKQVETNYMNEQRSVEMLNNVRRENVTTIGRYNVSYLNPQPASQPAPTKLAKKSKKKKEAPVAAPAEPPALEISSQNPSIYSHYQANVSQSTDHKHNGMAFNFNASSTLKNDYQRYIDNLRHSRYFATESTINSEKTKTQPQPTASCANNSSFSLLHRSSPSFSLAAQAFMNANTPPCPPAIYSSPYLQRPPDELLRPVVLQQGLMSAARGAAGYPPGYLNMHDTIHRSPWL